MRIKQNQPHHDNHASSALIPSSEFGADHSPENQLPTIQPGVSCPCEGDCPVCLPIQPKLHIEGTQSPAEQEADQVADTCFGTSLAGEPPIDPLQSNKGLQSAPSTIVVSQTTCNTIAKAKGKGESLAPSDRSYYQGMFQRNMDDVRIHQNAQAAQAADSIHAKAFTLGKDIFFSKGTYQPGRAGQNKLLSHELTHAVQNGSTTTIYRNETNDGDEKKYTSIDYQEAEQLNRYYWNRYDLAPLALFGDLDPFTNPVAYANEVYLLQNIIRKLGYDKGLTTQTLLGDGVLGQKTFYTLVLLSKAVDDYPEAIDALAEAGFHFQALLSIGAADPDDIGESINAAIADIIEAEVMAEWTQDIESHVVLDYFINDYAYDLFELPDNAFESEFFEEQPIPELSQDEIAQVYKKLYAGSTLRCSIGYLTADRVYMHRNDAKDFAIERFPGEKGQYLYELVVTPDYYTHLVDSMAIQLPDNKKIKALDQDMKTPLSKENDEQSLNITGFVFAADLPEKEPDQIQAAIITYLYEKELEQLAMEESTLAWIEDFQAKLDKRLAQEPDIASYEDLLALLAGPGGAPVPDKSKVDGWLEKASVTLGLVIKIGDDSEAFFLSYQAIHAARQQAVTNGSRPLKFGTFPAHQGSMFKINSHRFTAKNDGQGGATVGFSPYQLICNKETGEVCHPSKDWYYYEDNARHFSALEPVKIVISELNPNTTFWVQRWREIVGEDQWKQQTLWVLGSNLTDLSANLWEYADMQNLISWGDAILSIIAAGAVIAGPLIALEAGIAGGTIMAGSQQATIMLTKKMLKSTLWFVASEFLIQQMLDFDAKINEPENGYTEGEKQAWKAFKIALLVFAGAVLLRYAWKGLMRRAGSGMRAELKAMEKEILHAEMKTGSKLAKAEGLEVAEAYIKGSADDLTETVLESEGKSGGRSLFGKQSPPPSGPLSAELKTMYLHQLHSKWFRFKLKLYSKLTGKVIDWDSLIEMVESAEFREYASWREAFSSGGYAGLKDGQIIIGMAKPIRKIPFVGKGSMQHEIIHVFQELTGDALTREAAKTISYGEILRLEVVANFYGNTGIAVAFSTGVAIVLTKMGIFFYENMDAFEYMLVGREE